MNPWEITFIALGVVTFIGGCMCLLVIRRRDDR